MRPTQLLKNGLIFLALIFSKNLFEPSAVLKTLAAFLIFSPVSGGGLCRRIGGGFLNGIEHEKA
jgi:hypothetical protein